MSRQDGLTLQVLAGPARRPFRVEGEGPAVMGRSVTSDIVLDGEAVSRKHATVLRRRGVWYVVDEGSRSGTMLNGVRLPRSFPAPLGTGDVLRVGEWALRVVTGQAPAAAPARTVDDSSQTHRIERVPTAQQPGAGDRRLALLRDCLKVLSGATDEAGAARAMLVMVLAGSGYSRGAVLRRGVGEHAPEVLAEVRAPGATAGEMSFSRTLLDQAAKGDPVLLTEEAPTVTTAHSLAEGGVHSALCVPISDGGPVTGYVYLDARGREGHVRSDAAGFCEAAATALGLALGAMQRARAERRQVELQGELDAAREVQTLVMPPLCGIAGGYRYAIASRPGSFVAGDLVDVVPIRGGRVAVCMGDVAGHGVGSAMLMATAQAFLNAELQRLGPDEGPALAVRELNRYLAAKPLAGRFLSLWVGVLSTDGSLRYCDAGHGHWLLIRKNQSGRRALVQTSDGGIPIGIDPDAVYCEGQDVLHAGDALVLYSDGIVEQRGAEGDFGARRLIDEVVRGGSPRDDVGRVMAALELFAGTTAWDDDATIVAVELGEA